MRKRKKSGRVRKVTLKEATRVDDQRMRAELRSAATQKAEALAKTLGMPKIAPPIGRAHSGGV